MKNTKIKCFATLLALLGLHSAFGQATQTVNVNATIITGLSLTVNRHLNLGSIVPSTSGPISVTLDPSVSSSRTKSGTGGVLVGNGTSAILSITGHASQPVNIVLPTSVTVTSNSNQMTLNNFLSSAQGNSLTLDGTGSANFQIGATVNLTQNQAVGLYEGTFQVIVNY